MRAGDREEDASPPVEGRPNDGPAASGPAHRVGGERVDDDGDDDDRRRRGQKIGTRAV